MLRLLLPPNLASAATRDAIAVRLELDLGKAPPPELVAGLAVLQRIGAKPAPVSFLQLTRAQLAELTDALAGQPVFFWVNRPAAPIPWNGSDLPGVDEHLTVAKTAPPPLPPPAVTPAKAPPRRPEPEWKPMTVDGSEHFLAISLPSRGADDYEEIWDLLKRHGFTLEPSNGKFWLRNRHKTLNFLATYATELREHHGAEFTENFERNTAHIKPVGMTAEIKEEAGDYDVTLGLQAGNATENEILNAVNTSRSYIESGKDIYLVDPVRLAQLQAAHQALAGAPEAPGGLRRSHRIVRARVAEAQEILAEATPHFQPPETWTKRSAALHELATLAPAPVPAALNELLRPYQRLGVAWLWYLYHQQLGGILADEMGLGKTPQALALLASISRSENRGPTPAGQQAGTAHRIAPPHPSLVVCPASLMENWRREAARFTPELKVLVHHGGRRADDIAAFAAQDLIITSYGTLTRDDELFTALEFDLIIADEAQHLKNRRTQAAQSLRTLRGHGRFLLTGTPLENSLEDLRSLFEFLMPGFIAQVPSGVRGTDRAWYDERLRVQTAPYILRRTKLAVAPELPEKIEQTIWCEPTDDQAALYRRMQETTEQDLMKLAATGASQGTMHLAALTQLLRLRQICCDPRLIEAGRVSPDAPGVDAERRVKDNPPYRNSAKLEAFRELLAESIDEGHRMLVFSQFTSLLALLRAELETEGVAFCYLDGSMTARARQAAVDKFQDDDTVPVFLISLKAGGTGLNLTGADVVVHYDPWWNPAAEAQATDRTHRIGQTKVVTSYKLICAGTVEEKVLTLQDTKRALLADVFEASDAAAAKLSLADLRELLK